MTKVLTLVGRSVRGLADNSLLKFPTARAKLARADEHRLSIVPAIQEYATGGNRIHFDRKDNLDRVNEPIRVEYTVRKIDTPPDSWALVGGDSIQNTRAALDHAVWALVVKRRGEKFALGTRPRIQFPIVDDPSFFPEQRLESWGLKAPVVAAMRNAQPFFEGPDPRMHALWYLRELSNVDKHRMLHVIVLITEEARVIPDPMIPNGRLTIPTRGSLYKGAPVIAFSAPRPAHLAGTRVKVDLQLNAGICFDATETTRPVAMNVVLEAMHSQTVHVIDSLEAASSPPRRAGAR